MTYIDNFIDLLAKKLPEHDLVRMDPTFISGKELRLTGYKDVNGQPIEDDKTYELPVPVLKKVDHRHKMRIAHLAEGMQGLYNYLGSYLKPEDLTKIRHTFMHLNGN